MVFFYVCYVKITRLCLQKLIKFCMIIIGEYDTKEVFQIAKITTFNLRSSTINPNTGNYVYKGEKYKANINTENYNSPQTDNYSYEEKISNISLSSNDSISGSYEQVGQVSSMIESSENYGSYDVDYPMSKLELDKTAEKYSIAYDSDTNTVHVGKYTMEEGEWNSQEDTYVYDIDYPVDKIVIDDPLPEGYGFASNPETGEVYIGKIAEEAGSDITYSPISPLQANQNYGTYEADHPIKTIELDKTAEKYSIAYDSDTNTVHVGKYTMEEGEWNSQEDTYVYDIDYPVDKIVIDDPLPEGYGFASNPETGEVYIGKIAEEATDEDNIYYATTVPDDEIESAIKAMEEEKNASNPEVESALRAIEEEQHNKKQPPIEKYKQKHKQDKQEFEKEIRRRHEETKKNIEEKQKEVHRKIERIFDDI